MKIILFSLTLMFLFVGMIGSVNADGANLNGADLRCTNHVVCEE